MTTLSDRERAALAPFKVSEELMTNPDLYVNLDGPNGVECDVCGDPATATIIVYFGDGAGDCDHNDRCTSCATDMLSDEYLEDVGVEINVHP